MDFAPDTTPSSPRIALFDLDGTLTWRDTLQPFLSGYLARRPARWPRLWQLLPALLRYAGDRDRGRLKSRLIRAAMGGDSRSEIDTWAASFVGRLQAHGRFRPAALAVLESHRVAGHHLVLLSASPDLYVPRIGRLLGFERTLCTEIKWRVEAGGERLDGALLTANRRGSEKSLCLAQLRTQYPGLPVTAYGNSSSDLPHLELADSAVLVNAGPAARRAARRAGVAVADWS